jgi:catechol 2,3-dioxygenase-like lactoylglutathione lyase family enzyme
MTEIEGMHHVMIAIPKGGEDDARSFYGEALGLSELPKPETLRARGGVWFAAGQIQLHLGIDSEFRPATKAHIALQVSGVAALRDRLIAAGYQLEPDASLPGFERYYVADPFGNRIEILEPMDS